MSAVVNPRPVAVARSLVGKHLREYDRMMREKPGAERDCKPDSCKQCAYYHPDWEHRTCLYASCKYGKNIDVFKHHEMKG